MQATLTAFNWLQMHVYLTPWNGGLTGSDPDGDPITFAFLTTPNKGTLTSTDTTTGAFTYEPNAGQSGTDSFQFEVSDGLATSNVATVTVTFNAAPVTSNALIDALEDQPVNGTLQASDAEIHSLLFSIVSAPTKGAST